MPYDYAGSQAALQNLSTTNFNTAIAAMTTEAGQNRDLTQNNAATLRTAINTLIGDIAPQLAAATNHNAEVVAHLTTVSNQLTSIRDQINLYTILNDNTLTQANAVTFCNAIANQLRGIQANLAALKTTQTAIHNAATAAATDLQNMTDERDLLQQKIDDTGFLGLKDPKSKTAVALRVGVGACVMIGLIAGMGKRIQHAMDMPNTGHAVLSGTVESFLFVLAIAAVLYIAGKAQKMADAEITAARGPQPRQRNGA